MNKSSAYPSSKPLNSAYGRSNRISKMMVHTAKRNTLDQFLTINQEQPKPAEVIAP
jgi:hypothetical protein